jgi:hypothetical protein
MLTTYIFGLLLFRSLANSSPFLWQTPTKLYAIWYNLEKMLARRVPFAWLLYMHAFDCHYYLCTTAILVSSVFADLAQPTLLTCGWGTINWCSSWMSQRRTSLSCMSLAIIFVQIWRCNNKRPSLELHSKLCYFVILKLACYRELASVLYLYVVIWVGALTNGVFHISHYAAT